MRTEVEGGMNYGHLPVLQIAMEKLPISPLKVWRKSTARFSKRIKIHLLGKGEPKNQSGTWSHVCKLFVEREAKEKAYLQTGNLFSRTVWNRFICHSITSRTFLGCAEGQINLARTKAVTWMLENRKLSHQKETYGGWIRSWRANQPSYGLLGTVWAYLGKRFYSSL